MGNGHLFALWPVSPHSSQIVVCIQGQKTEQLLPLCPAAGAALAIGALAFRTREARNAFVGHAAAFAASFHSRAFVSVAVLQLERAFAI